MKRVAKVLEFYMICVIAGLLCAVMLFCVQTAHDRWSALYAYAFCKSDPVLEISREFVVVRIKNQHGKLVKIAEYRLERSK